MHGIIFSVVVIYLLSVFVSPSAGNGRKKRALGAGDSSCDTKPNLYFAPSCYNIFKTPKRSINPNPKEPGYIDFLGSAEMYDYAGTNILKKPVDKASVMSHLSLKVSPLNYKGKSLFGWFHVALESTLSTFPLTWVTRGDGVHGNWNYRFLRSFKPRKVAPELQGRYGRKENEQTVLLYTGAVPADTPLLRQIFSFQTYVLNSATSGKIPGVAEPSLIFVEDNYFGGADPAPPLHETNVECMGNIKDAHWVKDETPKYDFLKMVPFDTCMDNICPYGNSFEGRCNTNRSVYAFNDVAWLVDPRFTHRCYTLKPSPSKNESNWPEAKDYIEYVENYTQTCDNCTESVMFLKIHGIPVTSEIGKYVWASRQAHSLFMVIEIILMYPVSRFVARFYKETYMGRRVGANLHFWYSVHAYLSILLAVTLIQGMVAAIYGRKFYGFSLATAGQVHVICGYFALFLALLGVISSGVRLRPGHLRSISILVHFATGELFYFFGILSVITSMFVPGSPSGGEELPSGWEKVKTGVTDEQSTPIVQNEIK